MLFGRHLSPPYIAILLSSVCFSYQICAQTTTANPYVDLGYVKYRGVYDNVTDVNVFHGIAYAQPPLGELRWRKPRPIEEENGYNGKELDASSFGPMCPQALPASLARPGLPDIGTNSSEDCLLLDVYTPAQPVSTSLPVMVHFHGGGYTMGSARTHPGGAGIVYQSKGQMIYVIVQYRLGMFGFLAGSEIPANGEANVGLLDQRAALMWLQRHIAGFGGDPSRITIYGDSAGGGSVIMQLIGNGGSDTPPFSAAIAEYPWLQPLMNISSQNIQYQNVLQLAGCANLTCLRSVDSNTLQEINSQSQIDFYPSPGYGQGLFNYGPTVDGKFIRQLPSEELKRGHFHKVPFMTDRNAYEGVMFSNPNTTTQEAEHRDSRYLFPFAGPSFFARLYQLYPRSDFNSTFFRRQTWFGDMIVNCPTYYAASAFSDLSINSSAVFKLTFAAGSQIHAATAPFLFARGTTTWPQANNQTLAKIMTDYFVSFVVTHDPNPLRSPDAPFWSSYLASEAGGQGSYNVMAVTDNGIGLGLDPDADSHCDFFLAHNAAILN